MTECPRLQFWSYYVGKLVPRHLRGNVYRYSHPE